MSSLSTSYFKREMRKLHVVVHVIKKRQKHVPKSVIQRAKLLFDLLNLPGLFMFSLQISLFLSDAGSVVSPFCYAPSVVLALLRACMIIKYSTVPLMLSGIFDCGVLPKTLALFQTKICNSLVIFFRSDL